MEKQETNKALLRKLNAIREEQNNRVFSSVNDFLLYGTETAKKKREIMEKLESNNRQ